MEGWNTEGGGGVISCSERNVFLQISFPAYEIAVRKKNAYWGYYTTHTYYVTNDPSIFFFFTSVNYALCDSFGCGTKLNPLMELPFRTM